jgi:alkylhydroperoxidase family enzyme
LTEEEIEYSRRAAAPEPKAAQMLRFTQLIVLQRGEISDEDLGALRKAGFTDEEAIEIVANIALNIFTNYLNILSKTAGDFPAIADGPPESLLRESTQAPA